MFQMNVDPKKFVLDWISSEAFIPVNKFTAHKIGLTEAVLLAEALNQYKRWEKLGKLNEQGEFYWTVEDCQESTTLTADQQKRVFKSLENKKLLKRFKRQIKAGETKTSRYIKIYFENIPPVLFDDEEAAAARQQKAAERKAKIKEWNDKRKYRKSESGKSTIPAAARAEDSESGKDTFPESGKSTLPESGKAPTNKKELIIKKDLEEEEEMGACARIISFLISKDHKKENAEKFASRLIQTPISGYSDEDVLTAIDRSLSDCEKGICDEPYIWAVGKLERLLEAKEKAKKEPAAPQQPKQPRRKKTIRVEMLPDWFHEEKERERQERERQEAERAAAQSEKELSEEAARLKAEIEAAELEKKRKALEEKIKNRRYHRATASPQTV